MALLLQGIVAPSTLEVYASELLLAHPKDVLGLMSDAGLLTQLEQYIASVGERLSQKSKTFINVTTELLRERKLPFGSSSDLHGLVLEVNEKGRLDAEMLSEYLKPFRELGMQVALDDFGSGYNSFGRWKSLRPEFIKVRWEETDEDYIKGLLTFCETMDSTLVIEKVETAEQHQKVLEWNVPLAQGFYYSKPHSILPYSR